MTVETPKHQPLKGRARLIAAWHNSCAGLKDVWTTEEAFRLEVIALVLLTPISFLVASDVFQAAILIASLLFIMIVEVINSAIEATIDRIGPERHELSRTAKDLGSLAVLLATVLAVLLWLAAIVTT